MSLARVISKFGAGSRRDGEAWVRDGRVRVNDVLVSDPSRRVDPRRDRLTLDGRLLRPAPFQYLAGHKPRGVVTSRVVERGAPSAYDLLPADLPALVAPVGRLDKASEGLLLWTNDSRWADALLAPGSHVPKTYHVQIDRPPSEALMARLVAGVDVEAPGGRERLAVVEGRVLRTAERSGWLALVLDQGRNRHIRRLLAELDIEVRRLIRVAIGPLALGDLPPGAVRVLTVAERDALARAAGLRQRA